MSKEGALPDILVLTAINPIEQEGALVSPRLSEKVQEYKAYEGEMWAAFCATADGGLEESYEAHRLADYYHLRTSETLQDSPQNEQLWMQRFNLAGQEIYGVINPFEVAKVAAEDLQLIEAGIPRSIAANTYRRLAGGVEAEASITDTEKTNELREALFNTFPEILETIADLSDGPYNPVEIRDVFQTILGKLLLKNPAWEEWTITNPEGKTMLSVVVAQKEIQVPDGRAPVETKNKLLGLAMHEIGVHAQRAVNGASTGDELMEKGLPEYIDFEEGLGVLFEYLATGELPTKVKDRYIDIALATGAVDGLRLKRHELVALGVSREHARSTALYRHAADPDKVRKETKAHVNRIFRGGSGQAIKDHDGSVIEQAVFIKDMVYYTGFLKARDFAIEKIAAGFPADQIVEYLLRGKFDASNAFHTNYLRNRHTISL